MYLAILAYLYADETPRESEATKTRDAAPEAACDNQKQTRVAGDKPASDNESETRVAGDKPASDKSRDAAPEAACDSPNETDGTEAYELQPETESEVSPQDQKPHLNHKLTIHI